MRKTDVFSGLHICPSSSLDVPDEQSVRLVVLSPEYTYKQDHSCKALDYVEEILNNRGASPRTYRNMLLFIAPDEKTISSLRDGVRNYLAWKSVKEDSIDLNLDASQNRETDNNLLRSNQTVDSRINEVYRWLLVPYIDRDADLRNVIWESYSISGGSEDIIKKAASQVIQREALIERWEPSLLLMELNNLLWREDNKISIKKLWDYLCTYCYLPRLKNYEILETAIINGIDSSEYFAYAAGVNEERFTDLKYNQRIVFIDKSGFLVKVDVARKQILDDQAEKQPPYSGQTTGTPSPDKGTGNNSTSENTGDSNPVTIVVPDNSRNLNKTQREFFMSAQIDNTRIIRDVQKYVEEIVSHLLDSEDCKVEISLEVKASSESGFTQLTTRTVSENCRTLKVTNFEFDN